MGASDTPDNFLTNALVAISRLCFLLPSRPFASQPRLHTSACDERCSLETLVLDYSRQIRDMCRAVMGCIYPQRLRHVGRLLRCF